MTELTMLGSAVRVRDGDDFDDTGENADAVYESSQLIKAAHESSQLDSMPRISRRPSFVLVLGIEVAKAREPTSRYLAAFVKPPRKQGELAIEVN